MMSPDDFLDWLEGKLDEAEKAPGVAHEAMAEAATIQTLIEDFNREFDTRDSPLEPPPTDRKKKEKRT